MKAYFVIGGSWRHTASYLRASYRSRLDSSTRYFNLGFRLVRSEP